MSRFCIAKEFFYERYYIIPVEESAKFIRLKEFERVSNGSEDNDDIYKDFRMYRLLSGNLEDISFTDPQDIDGVEITNSGTGLILSDEYLK